MCWTAGWGVPFHLRVRLVDRIDSNRVKAR